MNTWSKKWKELLIIASGYLSFMAFALVGGYTIVKSEDEGLKKTAKNTFVVVLIFAALNALVSVINNFGYMGDNYYNTTLYDVCTILSRLISIAQITTYAVYAIITLLQKEEIPVEKKDEE